MRSTDAWVEMCDECGFDGREDTDLAGRLTAGYSTLASLLTREGSQRRPSEGTWSAVEYGDHVVQVTTGIIDGCRRALDLADAPERSDLATAGDAAVAFTSGLAVGDRALSVDLWPFDAAGSAFVLIAATLARRYSFDASSGSVEPHSGSWLYPTAGLITLTASVAACVLVTRGNLPRARTALAVAMWVGLVGLGSFILCSFSRHALMAQGSQDVPDASPRMSPGSALE